MHRLIASSVLCVLLSSQALAQRASSLPVGTRIRVMMKAAPGVWTEGVLGAVTEQGLRIDGQEYWRPGVTRVEVSEGRRSHFGRGVRAGALVGAVLGVAVLTADQRNSELPELVPAVAAGLVGAGALLGGVIGALSHHDRWRPVPVERLQVTLRPGRESRIGIRFGTVF